jgi:4-aminobutyrate aminotransferase
MIAVEFKDPHSPLTASHPHGTFPLPAYLNRLVQDACLEDGLLTLTTSIYPVLRMIPALIVSEGEAEEMLVIFAKAVKRVAEKILEQAKE